LQQLRVLLLDLARHVEVLQRGNDSLRASAVELRRSSKDRVEEQRGTWEAKAAELRQQHEEALRQEQRTSNNMLLSASRHPLKCYTALLALC
jgi:predicted HNH restriction endonuclease